MKTLIATILATAFLTGCETPVRHDQVRATIFSSPPGATISSGPVSGPAPREWTWTTRGPVFIQARWVSGATASQWLSIPMGGHVSVTMQRPAAPGLDADVRYAIALQQSIDASKRDNQDAIASTLRSYNDEKAAQARRPLILNPSVSCTSTVRAPNRIDTDCN